MISPAILTTESQGSLNLTPDCIISSVALRAKSTAEQVAEVCKYKLKVVLEQSLYQAKTIDYLNIIEGISDKHTCVLLVGHNPTVEEVIEMLTDSSDTIRMPPCALAHLNLQIEKCSDINKQEKINSRAQLFNIWRKEDLPSIENNHKSNSLQISTMHNIRIQVYTKIHLWDSSKI